jgi:hypothetical protein
VPGRLIELTFKPRESLEYGTIHDISLNETEQFKVMSLTYLEHARLFILFYLFIFFP